MIRESGRGGGVFCSLLGPVWVVVTEEPKSLLGISHRRRWLSTKLDPKRRTPILSPTSLPLKPGSGQLDGRRKANSDAVEKRGPFSADQNRPRKCPKNPRFLLAAPRGRQHHNDDTSSHVPAARIAGPAPDWQTADVFGLCSSPPAGAISFDHRERMSCEVNFRPSSDE